MSLNIPDPELSNIVSKFLEFFLAYEYPEKS